MEWGEITMDFRPCIVIPVFGGHARILQTRIDKILSFGFPIYIIDDGNSTSDGHLLEELGECDGVTILRHEENRGKGEAAYTGLVAAKSASFSHALLIDADAQHLLEDIPRFISTAEKNPDCLVLGYPIFGSDAPFSRVYGRKLTNWMISLMTLSGVVRDGLFGFRVYPIGPTLEFYPRRMARSRMGFEPSVVVYLLWSGVGVQILAVKLPIQKMVFLTFV